MSMYKCLNCGAVFEDKCEVIDYVDGRPAYKYLVCPDCLTDDIEELTLCRCGREYITDEQDRCDQCEREIGEAMSRARNQIMNGCNVGFQQATEDIVWWIENQ